MKRNKQFAYVKFAKTSEAAYAMEGLQGNAIGSDARPLKIVVECSISQLKRGGVTGLCLESGLP